MHCEECNAPLWRAGDAAPPGNYVRIDSPAQEIIALRQGETLPPSFDGHIALYRPSGRACCHTCTPASDLLPLSGDLRTARAERNQHHDTVNPTITR